MGDDRWSLRGPVSIRHSSLGSWKASMFTDAVTTPMRVEVLIELLNEFRDQPLRTGQIDRLLDPVAENGKRTAAEAIRAALSELRLVKTDDVWRLRTTLAAGGARELLLNAFDEQVL